MVLSQYLVVRTLHLLGVGVLVGGTAVLWLAYRVDDGVSVRLLSWFEATFWATIGLVAFTGLGNLFSFGVPDADSRAGTILTLKLVGIFVLTLGSVLRTFAVLHLRRSAISETSVPRLRWLYALTGWGFAFVLVLAGVLVRG